MHYSLPMLDHREAILELCCSPLSLHVCPAPQLHCKQWSADAVTFTHSTCLRAEPMLCNPLIASFSLFPCWLPLTFPPRESSTLIRVEHTGKYPKGTIPSQKPSLTSHWLPRTKPPAGQGRPSPAVLVSQGCCNKAPQTGRLNRNVFSYSSRG